jgi:Zn-dependent protease
MSAERPPRHHRTRTRRKALEDEARTAGRARESPLLGLSVLVGPAVGAAAWYLTGSWLWTIGAGVVGFLVTAGLGTWRSRVRARRLARAHRDAGRLDMLRRLVRRATSKYGKDEILEAMLTDAITAAATAEPASLPPSPPATDAPPVATVDELAESPRAPVASSFAESPSDEVLEPPPEIVAPPVPAEPVLSRGGPIVLGLAVPALLPGIGVLFAIPLLVLSLLLHRKDGRARWDRTVARGGLVVSALSFGFAAAGVAALSLSDPGESAYPEDFGEIPLHVWVIQGLVLLASLVLHECAHAAAARISGDPTAEDRGRLTLNPLKHLDPVGSVILPIVLAVTSAPIFGWARPVPVNPLRYRHPRRGEAFVSSAGVLTNLLLALFCGGALLLVGLVLTRVYTGVEVRHLSVPLMPTVVEGVALAPVFGVLVDVLKAGIVVNCLLAFLNILPIPPLDGYHLLTTLLPARLSALLARLQPVGFLVLVGLFALGAIDVLLVPGIVLALGLHLIAGGLLGV